jgi:hypothetical protein
VGANLQVAPNKIVKGRGGGGEEVGWGEPCWQFRLSQDRLPIVLLEIVFVLFCFDRIVGFYKSFARTVS